MVEQRLHLGAGNDILVGWVNHDLTELPGVDVVHDLETTPWPWDDGTFSRVRLHHVLEHLADPVGKIAELHRITAPGGIVEVRVPYWNSQDFASDPTHRTAFNEHTFDYFDPTTRHGRERPYYSTARFRIRGRTFWIKPAVVYIAVHNATAQQLLSAAARHLGGIIWVVEWELERI